MLQANTRLTERINAELEAEAGLPLSWFEVLAKLSWAPESCSRMGALADDLLLSRGGTTRLIARMEEAGLVRREVPAHDRRATYAHVTDKGQEALERAVADPHGQGRRVLPAAPHRGGGRGADARDGQGPARARRRRDWLLADLEAAPQ